MRSSQWTSAPAVTSASASASSSASEPTRRPGWALPAGVKSSATPMCSSCAAGGEPDAAARPQRLGLLELAQPEQAAVEAARLALAAGRRGDLDVVEPFDHPNTPSGS